MNKIQEQQFQTLKEFDKICRRNHFPYVLGYGSLLGCVRHNGFIPWDDDIDIFVTREIYDKIVNCLKSSSSAAYSLINWDSDSSFFAAFSKFQMNRAGYTRRTAIDIFPLDECPNKCSAAFQKWHKRRKRLHYLIQIKSLGFSSLKTGKQRIAFILFLCFSRRTLIKRYVQVSRNFEGRSSYYMTTYHDSIDVFPKELLLPIEKSLFEGAVFPIPVKYDAILTSIYGDWRTPPPIGKRHGHL